MADACSVRPGLKAFFHPAFLQVLLYLRRVIGFFCDSGSVPYSLKSDVASGDGGTRRTVLLLVVASSRGRLREGGLRSHRT